MTESLGKKISRKSVPEKVRRIVETIFACKWSLTILCVIQDGINRPGAIHRSIEGLSPKVMNHCLSKLLEFSILEKKSYPEVPPRVEYEITDFGERFLKLFDLLDILADEMAAEPEAVS
ncbi:MAG: helix-turn-helix domain-containing protein [Acidobacteriota bacterium]|nr:helix-turn-helix domain-containing protein [Acidobacteriota bacterium]